MEMDFNPFKHKISELNSLNAQKGNVLVAEPFMQDQYFKRSVVLLCENNKDGAIGFILNQELDLKFSDVISEELGFDAPLFLGGPVEAENLFFVHKCEELTESISIGEDLYWSGNFDLLKIYLKAKKVLAHEIRFFLGYSGWDPKQLNNELKSESWLISKISSDDIFETEPEELWRNTMNNMGKEQALLATFPEDPSLN